MNDHEVIAILVGVLALLAGGLGYGLGEQRRHRDETTQYTHLLEGQIEEHERRLRAHGALIEVIAEDYDPPNGNEPTPEQRRAAFKVIRGGGASAIVLLLTGVLAWLRKHWRSLATAIAASGAAAFVAVAVLAHGAPPAHHPQAGRSPSPPGPTQTAHTGAPEPTTKPSHTPHRVVPPPPVIATRRKPSPPAAGRSSPAAPPPPRPSPTRSPTPPRTPTPSPSPTCPAGVAVHLPGAGITICI